MRLSSPGLSDSLNTLSVGRGPESGSPLPNRGPAPAPDPVPAAVPPVTALTSPLRKKPRRLNPNTPEHLGVTGRGIPVMSPLTRSISQGSLSVNSEFRGREGSAFRGRLSLDREGRVRKRSVSDDKAHYTDDPPPLSFIRIPPPHEQTAFSASPLSKDDEKRLFDDTTNLSSNYHAQKTKSLLESFVTSGLFDNANLKEAFIQSITVKKDSMYRRSCYTSLSNEDYCQDRLLASCYKIVKEFHLSTSKIEIPEDFRRSEHKASRWAGILDRYENLITALINDLIGAGRENRKDSDNFITSLEQNRNMQMSREDASQYTSTLINDLIIDFLSVKEYIQTQLDNHYQWSTKKDITYKPILEVQMKHFDFTEKYIDFFLHQKQSDNGGRFEEEKEPPPADAGGGGGGGGGGDEAPFKSSYIDSLYKAFTTYSYRTIRDRLTFQDSSDSPKTRTKKASQIEFNTVEIEQINILRNEKIKMLLRQAFSLKLFPNGQGTNSITVQLMPLRDGQFTQQHIEESSKYKVAFTAAVEYIETLQTDGRTVNRDLFRKGLLAPFLFNSDECVQDMPKYVDLMLWLHEFNDFIDVNQGISIKDKEQFSNDLISMISQDRSPQPDGASSAT